VEVTLDAEKRELDTTGDHGIQEAEPDSLTGCESETYGNRIHYCLVVPQQADYSTHTGQLKSS
jgi:hypothetical protein